MAKSDLTADEVRQLLDYDPSTGIFTRKTDGSLAGGLSVIGYHRISIKNKRYWSHRLAWLHYYGRWPYNEIDHINGNRADNRISNLRDIKHHQNLSNRNAPSNNTSGHKGVHRWKDKWHSHIGHAGKIIYLGLFETKEEAIAAYTKAAKEIHGEFSR